MTSSWKCLSKNSPSTNDEAVEGGGGQNSFFKNEVLFQLSFSTRILPKSVRTDDNNALGRLQRLEAQWDFSEKSLHLSQMILNIEIKICFHFFFFIFPCTGVPRYNVLLQLRVRYV